MNIQGRTIIENKLIKKIIKNGNQHVLYFWKKLNEEEKNKLIIDLSKTNFKKLKKYYNNYKKNKCKKIKLDKTDYFDPDDFNDIKSLKSIGENALFSNQVGFLTVAGGQGSRLDYPHPKGCFPITPVKNKSLFQLFAEKIRYYSDYYKNNFYWLIMTSHDNNVETENFFIKNKYFGLDKNKIIFFNQGMLPSLSLDGKLILENKFGIFKNPDGHGGIIKALFKAGLLKMLKVNNIKHLVYFQIDNPMVDMCDPYFIGCHINQKSQVTSKVIKKSYPEEKLGVICKINNKKGIIEYSDLTNEEMNEKDKNGVLKYCMGSIAIHIFNTDFLINCSKIMPVHHAIKKVEGYVISSFPEIKEMDAIKFESFVFDSIPMARKAVFYETKRETEFFPLKNKSGVDSIKTCIYGQIDLFKQWLVTANILTEQQLKNKIVEISPLFSPNQELFLMKVKNDVEKINRCIYDSKGNINENIYIE